MNETSKGHREGSLEVPTRHPLLFKEPEFYDPGSLFKEMERVFDICHGCRRCVSLCNAFPTLFDLVDGSQTLEIDGVAKSDYWKVVEHCYLCDLCFMTKCPYVPPHPWNVDFPHLMLRAKAVKFKQGKTRIRDKLLSAPDTVGRIAGIPVVAQSVNAATRSRPMRTLMQKSFGIHPDAFLPSFHSDTFRKQFETVIAKQPQATSHTRSQTVLFSTCYGNWNDPALNKDLVAVFQHNGISVRLLEKERCCGMPKLELGDLDSVERAEEDNVGELAKLVDLGWDIVTPIPSCTLMFKQELPLLFPDDAELTKVRAHTFDPFEYLMLRHKAGKLRTDFKHGLGRILYHVPCHQRVQNIGLKTRDVLKLVPDTEVEVIERCSGHDGTYAFKNEYHAIAKKIGKPVSNRVEQAKPDHYVSDCPLAARQIEDGLVKAKSPESPFRLLCMAYGI
ncbi:MAG: heterodisulfide reductase-related iron-sulfur binding cluster [Gammaproteobacteria bacterium]